LFAAVANGFLLPRAATPSATAVAGVPTPVGVLAARASIATELIGWNTHKKGPVTDVTNPHYSSAL
jgi:hypothetical protein